MHLLKEPIKREFYAKLMTTITARNLYSCFNAGTPNNKQLAMFGMKWPLRNKWAHQMIGLEVPDDFLTKLEGLRKKQATSSKPEPLLLLTHDDFFKLHPQPDGNFYLTHAQNEPVTLDSLNQLLRAINYTRKQLK